MPIKIARKGIRMLGLLGQRSCQVLAMRFGTFYFTHLVISMVLNILQCDDCAEKGRLAKHVRESGHTFLWYSLDIKPTRQREGAPPPYNGFSH
jgi:hypothetical protein